MDVQVTRVLENIGEKLVFLEKYDNEEIRLTNTMHDYGLYYAAVKSKKVRLSLRRAVKNIKPDTHEYWPLLKKDSSGRKSDSDNIASSEGKGSDDNANRVRLMVMKWEEARKLLLKENLSADEMADKLSTQWVLCRSWENLSRALRGYEATNQEVTVRTVEQFIKKTGIAHDFYKLYWVMRQQLDEKDMKKILSGKTSDLFINKVRDKGFDYCYQLVSILEKELVSQYKAGITAPKAGNILTNIYDFLARLPRADALLERFYNLINTSEDLLKVLASYKNDEYLHMAAIAYGKSA